MSKYTAFYSLISNFKNQGDFIFYNLKVKIMLTDNIKNVEVIYNDF